MSRHFIFLFIIAAITTTGWTQEAPVSLVLIKGGSFKHTGSNFSGSKVTVSDFYLGKYEVTQKEWMRVMGVNPAAFKGDDLPVEMVSWYDCIEYCNKLSQLEGLQPYYTVSRDKPDPDNLCEVDELKWTVTVNQGADGYRLPTEAEWEYAAGGGQETKDFIYSGGNEAAKVAWYWQNSGDAFLSGIWNWPAVEKNRGRTHPVGSKEPNELGLYDMSGNVREWCWDWSADRAGTGGAGKGPARGSARVWKGGGWMGGDFCCEPAFRANYEPSSRGNDQGFRICRNK